jgi:hypothetical protein
VTLFWVGYALGFITPWDDLRELLSDARADAIRFVEDVKTEELQKARADERKKIVALIEKTAVALGELSVSGAEKAAVP